MADAAPTAAAPEASKPASQQGGSVKPEGLAEKAAGLAEGAPPPPEEEKKKHVPNPKTREFAALTRKEREIKALLSQQRQEAAEIAELRKLRAESKKNPDAWLKAGGLTYDEVTNHYVAGDAPPDPRYSALEERIAKAQAETAELRAALQKKEEDRAVSNYIDDIKKIAQDDPDLELVREYDAYTDVYELIDLHYQQTGEILDKHDAAKQIEDVLFEEKSKEGQKLLAAKKLRQKLGLAERTDPASGSSEPHPSPKATGTATITNEMTPSAGAIPPSRKLTDDERWEAIVARARAGE